MEKERRDAALKRGTKRAVDVGEVGREKERARRRRKVGLLGREEGKMRGVWEVRKNTPISYVCPVDFLSWYVLIVSVRYNLLLPLHYMYLSYVSEMLPLPAYPKRLPTLEKREVPLPSGKLENGLGCEQLSSRLVKADFTGACVRGTFRPGILEGRQLIRGVVKRSKNRSLVGLEGIVVQETAETFKVVTCANIIKGECKPFASRQMLTSSRNGSDTEIARVVHDHDTRLLILNPSERTNVSPTALRGIRRGCLCSYATRGAESRGGYLGVRV